MMNIFKKKYTYKIVSDLETTRKIQEFVDPYRIEKTSMIVEVCGSIMDENNLVTVTFVTYTNPKEFVENLKKEFVCYDIHDRRTTAFVWKEKKEEEES